jgi:hypothetical protein
MSISESKSQKKALSDLQKEMVAKIKELDKLE